ncbi:uncharacterized protein LOC130625735 isoform X2 [Hydractinia symbiolongicarpus]|nr:uncharacterized protein LOC130625735 isoform X2 [Hydractinia symbiolongicarpus]
MDECVSKSSKITCGGDDICYSASTSTYGNLEMALKGCVKKEKCDSYTLCGTVESFCQYKCCKDVDYCNSSSVLQTRTWLGVVFICLMLVVL